jgi:DNA primase
MFGRAAFLPKGEDPDTFVRSRGQAAVETLLDQAIPLADYYFSWVEQTHGQGLEGKSQIAAEISRLLAKVKNPVEADLLVRRAVDTLGIREEILRRPLMQPAGTPSAKRSTSVLPATAPQMRDDVAERSLVSLMLRFPAVMGEFDKHEGARQWMDPRWHEVIDLMIREWQEHGSVDAFQVSQKVSADRASELAGLALQDEKISETESVEMAADCLAHLRRKHLKSVERKLRIAIRAAEENKDEKAKRERILEWQDVVREERRLERRKLEAKTITS